MLSGQDDRFSRDRAPLGLITRTVQHLEIPLLIGAARGHRSNVVNVDARQVRRKPFHAPRAHPGLPPGQAGKSPDPASARRQLLVRRAAATPGCGELGTTQRPGVPARPTWATHVHALICAGSGARGRPVPGPVLDGLGPPRVRICPVPPPGIGARPLADRLSLRRDNPAAQFLSALCSGLTHPVRAAGRPTADRARGKVGLGIDRAPEQVIVHPLALWRHRADTPPVRGRPLRILSTADAPERA